MTQSQPPLDGDGLIALTAARDSPNCRPYGKYAHVLSDVDSESQLQDVPTAICCPNCGEAVALFKRGLPPAAPYFDTTCEQCGVDLRSWCAVAVDAAYLQVVDPSMLIKTVQQFWNDWLWSGITNSKGEPRNDEYTTRLTTKATEFGWNWEVTCPLCRRPLTELEHASAVSSGRLDYLGYTYSLIAIIFHSLRHESAN